MRGAVLSALVLSSVACASAPAYRAPEIEPEVPAQWAARPDSGPSTLR